MVDLDIGTENMRWMGDSRFVLGFIRGAVANRARKVRIKMKIVEHGADKVHLARVARALGGQVKVLGGGTLEDGLNAVKLDDRENESSGEKTLEDIPDEELDLPMPVAPSVEPDDSWVTITSKGASDAPYWKSGEGVLYIKWVGKRRF
jgi:sphingosine kinase